MAAETQDSSVEVDKPFATKVEAMAGYGVPETDIGRVLGIDAKTLRKHYRDELDNGHVKANVKVAENLYRKATGEGREAVVAAIFWLKTRAGWKETSVHEVGGRDGGPVELEVVDETAREKLAKVLLLMAHRANEERHAELLPPPGASSCADKAGFDR